MTAHKEGISFFPYSPIMFIEKLHSWSHGN